MVGVTIEDVKKNFRNFINRVSRMKERRLNEDDLRDFSIQVEILARLLKLKDYDTLSERLDNVKKSVLSNKIIKNKDIEDLRGLLNSF